MHLSILFEALALSHRWLRSIFHVPLDWLRILTFLKPNQPFF